MKLRAARRMQGIERTLIRQIFDAAPADAINLGLGQPDLPTPDVAALAGIGGICRGKTGYTSTAGDPELRAAVAECHRPFARGSQNTVITVGSQEAMFLSCLALADPGDEILYPDPGYPAYPIVARLIGAEPVPYALRADHGFRLDVEEIERRLTPRTRLVIVCEPSNPTGACSDGPTLDRLAALLERRGVLWLSDEIYSSFTYTERPFDSLAARSANGVVVSGLSKRMSMTGWRVGWVVGPDELMPSLIAAHQYLVTCAPSVSQRAGLAALSPAGRAAEQRYLARFARRRRLMAEALRRVPQVRFALPDGAFYFFVDVRAHGPSLDVGRRLLERCNVVTIPGVAFGTHGEGHLRLSFAASEDAIVEGLRRIGEELGEQPPRAPL